jgi:hypothetical protein
LSSFAAVKPDNSEYLLRMLRDVYGFNLCFFFSIFFFNKKNRAYFGYLDPRPTGYLLPFDTPGRHTQAWASPPPQPVTSWPHHHHCWLSVSRRSAGRYLERFWSVPRAFLERFFERFFDRFWASARWFSAQALHSAHLRPPFAAPMA